MKATDDFAVVRYRPDGRRDGTFGRKGRARVAVTPFPGGDSALRAVTTQDNGRIVGAGQAPATLAANGFAVERVLAA
ncbi:MAG TPA: hypothetical protein VJN50_03825 [Actinomycetota bacterium]|nr:hypothetical protein [Actinomycetota bacterium]